MQLTNLDWVVIATYGVVAVTTGLWFARRAGRETDEFFLYFGAYYPYQDFTVVVPGEVAYRFSRNPDRYFDNDYVMVTGLITEFDGKPEIVVKHADQLRRY